MANDKVTTNFDYGSNMDNFFDQVKQTIVQQDDYRGIGGHGLQDHGPHGLHDQTIIGIGNATVNFRNLKP